MTTPTRPAKDRRDADGVRVVRSPRSGVPYWAIGLAVGVPIVATVVAVALIRLSPARATSSAPVPADAVVAAADVPRDVSPPPAPPTPARSPGRIAPRRVVTAPVEEPAGLGASPVPQVEKPRREIDAADVIEALREEGIHDGIAAFGVPGSHPPKSGILVPEEFELPEGYVRHYQSTDDGQQLPAILMFHPDYEFVNEAGEVVKLPEDGVVPPEMAPPGLDVGQVLSVPERKRGEPIR